MFEKQDLLQEKKWLGVFFNADSYVARFPGELRYGPEQGVQLKYLAPHAEPEPSRYLHGILDSGEKCTLLGRFDASHGGHTQRGDLRTFQAVHGFSALAVGAHCSPQSTFNELAVTYTGMQEFFFPTGFKEWEPFTTDIHASIATPWGKIEVYNTGSFLPLSKSPEVHFHSDDKDALIALKSAIEGVTAKHPRAYFKVKKDVGFALRFLSDAETPLKELLVRVDEFGDLLAILQHQPVHPQSLTAMRRFASDPPIESVELYPTYLLDKDTLSLCAERVFDHRVLAIDGKSSNFPALIEQWLKEPQRHETLSSALQHQKRHKTLHALHGDVVLYVSMLEAITIDDRGTHFNGDKYQYPIDTYAGDDLRDRLLKLMNVANTGEVAVRLSALRNEIVHVGRPRDVLRKLGGHDLLNLTDLLQLIVLTHLLKSIGADTDQIRRYQHLALRLRP